MQSGAPRKRRDSSPAPCAVKRAAVVTESAAEPTVAVPLAFLKNLSTAVGAIMNGLMTLPCEDVAARGRHVANLSKVQSSINEQLGVKKRVRTQVNCFHENKRLLRRASPFVPTEPRPVLCAYSTLIAAPKHGQKLYHDRGKPVYVLCSLWFTMTSFS